MGLTAILLASSLAATTPHQAILGRLFDAFNRHDARTLQTLYARGARLTSSDFCKPRTGADVTRTYNAIFRALPDIRDDIVSIVVDHDQAAVRFIASGGKDGNAFRFKLITFFRFVGVRIVEDDTVFDTHGRPCEA